MVQTQNNASSKSNNEHAHRGRHRSNASSGFDLAVFQCNTRHRSAYTKLTKYQVGGADGEEYEVHLLGINQMLLIRGGMGNLGMRGMIRNWLKICYGPWSHDWHYGLFADFHGIKRLLHE